MTNKELDLYIYDLVMFRNKETKSISLETVYAITSIQGIHICATNNFRFDESNLKIILEGYNYLADWYRFYDDNIEIVGIWRFDNLTKDYKVVYYEGTVEI